MKSFSLLFIGLLASSVAAKSTRYVERLLPTLRHRHGNPMRPAKNNKESVPREVKTIIPQNANTTKFAVDGTALPDVNFDVGESYAGLLPISSAADAPELFFWFFPSSNPNATDEITIWLNGGPGCSSLEGFLQENGPVLWQYGTFAPVPNPWTWVQLTNMIWVEQPVGTGFTQGRPTATNEDEVAEQFMGFFKNFVDTFGIQNRKVYVAGESYAGFYVPYIANAMLNANDTTHFNLQGTLIYDPVMGNSALQDQIPVVPMVDKFPGLFNLNDTFNEHVHQLADTCGYTDYYNNQLVFPPTGPFPPTPSQRGCDLWDTVLDAVFFTNPCFDIYQIATTCPVLWDVLGFPGSFDFVPPGATIYFNRSDVQKAINAPMQEWEECSGGVLNRDTSAPSAWTVYPSVIERSQRTIWSHGALDYILIADGSLLVIQNMTWGGVQGFQEEPNGEFFVPYHVDVSDSTLAASGVMGRTRTERNFTFCETFLSGHMGPQYQPSASFRQLEYLLGRIDSLEEVGDFTTPPVFGS